MLRITGLSIESVRGGRTPVPILKGFEMHVAAGQIVVILGNSGAGKSSILNVVAGFVELGKAERGDGLRAVGEIWIAGKDVSGVPTGKRRIGLVPQNVALFPHMTVFENLSFPLRVGSRRIPRAEWKEPIARVARSLGIEHLLGHRPETIAGGEAQRVALGRLLVVPRQVALLDEPFSHLDVFTKKELRNLVRSKLTERGGEVPPAVLWVSHDLDDARVADRIVVIRRDSRAATPAAVLTFEGDALSTAWTKFEHCSDTEVRSLFALGA